MGQGWGSVEVPGRAEPQEAVHCAGPQWSCSMCFSQVCLLESLCLLLNLHAFCEEETVGFMSLHNLPETPLGGSERNGIS